MAHERDDPRALLRIHSQAISPLALEDLPARPVSSGRGGLSYFLLTIFARPRMRTKGVNSLARGAAPIALAMVLAGGCTDSLSSVEMTDIELRASYSQYPNNLKPDPSTGEPYPIEAPGTAFAETKIDLAASNFTDFTCDYPDGSCTFDVMAVHEGIWNGTEQEVRIALGNVQTSPRLVNDNECIEVDVLPETICSRKRSANRVDYQVNSCNVLVTAAVEHRAWWLGKWQGSAGFGGLSLSLGAGRLGEKVRYSSPSLPPSLELPACASSGGSGGGGNGGGSEEECWDVYIVWYDPDTGIVEFTEYLFTYCTGGNVE